MLGVSWLPPMEVRTQPRMGKPTRVAPGLAMLSPVKVIAEDCNGYDVELEVVPQNGRLSARKVTVKQRPDGPPVTGEAIRSIPVAGLASAAARHVMVAETGDDGRTWLSERPLTPEIKERIRTEGLGDFALSWVAYLYRLALLIGAPPTKEVEQALGLSRATTGRWIAAARERGYLGAVEKQGKASG